LQSLMISLRLALAMLVATTIPTLADEGMWLFNNPPLKQLKEKYQFEPTPQWLEHLQKASVRFNSGGSGSFVSANGLCITNHHVGADALQKASSEQHNYLKDGFYAKSQAEEIKCTDLELNVLISIEDVTARVNGAVKPAMSPDAASKARDGAIAAIETYRKCNAQGPSDGELTFVSGSPGRTARQLAADELADRRDHEVPKWLQMFNRREILVNSWSQRSFENARRGRDDLFGDQNNRKRYDGYVAALFDPEIWKLIEGRDKKLRDAITPKFIGGRSVTAAYDAIKKAQAEEEKIAARYDYLEQERPITVGYRGPRAF